MSSRCSSLVASLDDDDYDYNDDFGCGDDIESIICYVFSAILSFIPFSRIYNLCQCPRFLIIYLIIYLIIILSFIL